MSLLLILTPQAIKGYDCNFRQEVANCFRALFQQILLMLIAMQCTQRRQQQRQIKQQLLFSNFACA